MSLLTMGVSKLSQIEVDADKDWGGKGISNLKELALGMAQGDILVHNGTKLVRLSAGVANTVLTAGGSGVIPSWQPGGTYYNRYFPATISQSKALAIVAVAQGIARNAPLTREYKYAYLDDVADLIKLLTPAVSLTNTETVIVAPDQTWNKNAPVARQYDLQIVVGGGVADDGGVETDETSAAQNATANDLTLLPAVPAVGDAYDFGFDKVFDVIRLVLGIQGVGTWTVMWKYWNGAWTNLAGVTDPTNGFRAVAGTYEVAFTRPGDWALKVIQGKNLYWVRAEVTAYTSITTQPKGTQAWIKIIT
jgi:hypothetical protein